MNIMREQSKMMKYSIRNIKEIKYLNTIINTKCSGANHIKSIVSKQFLVLISVPKCS